MLKLRIYTLALVLGLAVTPLAWAQDPPSQSPNPAAQEPTPPTQPLPADKPIGDKPKDEPPIAPVVAGTANDAPLTGASMPIIGLVSSRSYVLPSVLFFGQLDSNAGNTSENTRFASINTLMGSLAIQKLGRASQFNLGYLLGRSFSNQGGDFNATTHDFAVSHLWSRGRWDGFFYERLLYSSQTALLGGAAPFEVSGLSTVGGLASNGPVILRTSFLPGQGIFTEFGPRLSNVTVAQVNNHLSRRLFFTLVGNYNTLRFFNSDFINSSAGGFQAGLGYQSSRTDTFAIVYRYNDFWYSSLPITVRDNVIEGAYQRQLGERLLFQVGAGPEITFIQNSVLTTTTPTPNPGPGTLTNPASSTRVSWTADASLRYQLRRVGLVASYSHYLASGSGVFLAAVTDRVSAGLSHQLSRVWTANVTASYAHNLNLIPFFNAGLGVPANAAVDSVYGGFEMHRRIGRDSEAFFGYLGRYQTASYETCPTGICKGGSLVGHQFNFGFAWRLKPVPVD